MAFDLRSPSGDMNSDHSTDLDMDTYLTGNTVWFGVDSHTPSLFTAPDT